MGCLQIKDKHKHCTRATIYMNMLKPRKNIVFFDNDDDNVIRINILYFLYDLVTAKGKGERHSASLGLGGPTRPIGRGRNMYFSESQIILDEAETCISLKI